MRSDEAIALAARAAMRTCPEDGQTMDFNDWAGFADCAAEASLEAAEAVRAARDAFESGARPQEARLVLQQAFIASLTFSVAALAAMAHLPGLDEVEWVEKSPVS